MKLGKNFAFFEDSQIFANLRLTGRLRSMTLGGPLDGKMSYLGDALQDTKVSWVAV